MDGDRKIVLVTRPTRLQELVARYNTVEQARFHAEHLDMDFGDFLKEDRTFQRAVCQVSQVLAAHGKLQRLDRSFLPNFLFPPTALVVVLGQDGLVANTLKYLDGQPLLAINPDPARWEGILLPFQVDDLQTLLPEVLLGRRPVREITMARARLSDGQSLLAVNDFFVGARTHVSARYELSHGGRTECQSSSGIIISTGMGSTGWLRSVLTGARAITGRDHDQTWREAREKGLDWSSPNLVFSVREPYPGRSTGSSLVLGQLKQGAQLRVRSLMPVGGVIFSDGMESDGLEFCSGMEVLVHRHESNGKLTI